MQKVAYHDEFGRLIMFTQERIDEIMSTWMEGLDHLVTHTCGICGEEFHDGENGHRFYDMDVCDDCTWDYIVQKAHEDDAFEFVRNNEEVEEEFLLEWFNSLEDDDKIALLRKGFNENEIFEEDAIAEFCIGNRDFNAWIMDNGEVL